MADDNHGDTNPDKKDSSSSLPSPPKNNADVRNDQKNDKNTTNDKNLPGETPNDAQNAGDYAKAVNQWLWQCYYWQSVAAGFPYYLSQALNQGLNSANDRQILSRLQQQQQGNRNVVIQQVIGRTFRIPKLWKRLAAEIIDCCILFLLKLVVTFIAIDFFDIIDLEKFDFATLQEDLLDYRMAFEITSEMVVLEIVHRFVVCFFEAMCLHRGTPHPGGATPGKIFLGLKVVSCHSIRDLGNGLIGVEPGGDLGFTWALLRSFIKNFSLVFFFPICFTLFILPYNRTAYDVLCNCIVVEEIPRRRR